MAAPGAERDWTETQKRNDWPLQKREQGLPDGQGPDMWDPDTEKPEGQA